MYELFIYKDYGNGEWMKMRTYYRNKKKAINAFYFYHFNILEYDIVELSKNNQSLLKSFNGEMY